MEQTLEAKEVPNRNSRDVRAMQVTRAHLEKLARDFREAGGFAITPWVQLICGIGEGIDGEEDLVRYVIAIANGETDRTQWEDQLRAGTVKLEIQGLKQLEADRLMFGETRSDFRRFLSAVITDRGVAVENFLRDADSWLKDIWILPRIERTGGGVMLRQTTVIPGMTSFNGFIRALFLDEQQMYGRDLRQCQLETCANFFLVKRRSGRDPRYCSRDCRLKVHDMKAAKRMRTLRKKRAGARKHK